MADYSKAFSSNFPTIPFGSVDLGYDFSKSLNSSGGGEKMAGPFTLAAAGIGALGSFFGAKESAEASKQVGQGYLNAAADRLRNEVMLGRESAYGGAAQDIASRRAQGTWMPDLELGRQMYAMGEKIRNFGPAEQALRSEEARRQRFANISREQKESDIFQNLLNTKRRQAEIEGPYAAMFGPKAKTIVSDLVG